MIQQRKKRSSTKANLIFSVVFHGVLVILVVVLAAKSGIIPQRYLPTTLLKPEEKKPEEKKPEPKVEPPKVAEAPKVNVPEPKVQASAPPPVNDSPAVAPAAAIVSGFEFSDGAKAVTDMASDPRSIYKALVEHTLRSRWNRPDDMADDNFVAQVEVTIDSKGNIKNYNWISGSGNVRWDNSVKAVMADVKVISKVPPKDFPQKFVTRFDVESARGEAITLSSR